MNSNEIQIGDTLDLQKGRLVYIGDGKADAQQYVADKGFVTVKAGVVLSAQQIESWQQLNAKRAATSGTRTSATL